MLNGLKALITSLGKQVVWATLGWAGLIWGWIAFGFNISSFRHFLMYTYTAEERAREKEKRARLLQCR